MAIFDFLKEIPLSAVLREKLKDVEAEVTSLKAENLALRAAIDSKDSQIKTLSEKLLPPSHEELPEVQEFMLRVLARQDQLSEQQLAPMVHVGTQVAAYHLEELRKKKLVYASHIAGSDWSGDGPRTEWSLVHGGREYLIRKGLLE